MEPSLASPFVTRSHTGHAYQTFLKDPGIRVSMSRKGNCWDNTVMERFFGTLKRACTSRASLATHEVARTALFEYIGVYYNRVRKHTTLGNLSSKPDNNCRQQCNNRLKGSIRK
jgi:transposase InsO family protein